MTNIDARTLPHAPVSVTVVHDHLQYDPGVMVVQVARDWQSRGLGYILDAADLDPETRILAVFPGRHRSALGDAIQD